MKKIITFLLILPIILSSCFSKKTEEQITSSGNISSWKIENNSWIIQTWKTEEIKEISNSGNTEKIETNSGKIEKIENKTETKEEKTEKVENKTEVKAEENHTSEKELTEIPNKNEMEKTNQEIDKIMDDLFSELNSLDSSSKN